MFGEPDFSVSLDFGRNPYILLKIDILNAPFYYDSSSLFRFTTIEASISFGVQYDEYNSSCSSLKALLSNCITVLAG